MRITKSKLAILAALLCALAVLTMPPISKSQNKESANIANVDYAAEIPSNNPVLWSLTIHNVNRSENEQGEARFFFEFYADETLFFDEYNSTRYKTWLCTEGETVTHRYQLSPWQDITPVTRDLKIKLYWFYNATATLEDTASFKVSTTILMPLQHIYATSYLAIYLMACFLLLTYDYISSLEE